MTGDDLKLLRPMREVMESYGFKINRNGFCKCPFHHDNKTPSLKVYKDSYYCFGCGSSGDIYTFAGFMEDLDPFDKQDFPKIFKILGGEYEHSFSARRKIDKIKKEREKKKKEQAEKQFEISLCYQYIDIYKRYITILEPFSDAWCENINALMEQIAKLEYLEYLEQQGR